MARPPIRTSHEIWTNSVVDAALVVITKARRAIREGGWPSMCSAFPSLLAPGFISSRLGGLIPATAIVGDAASRGLEVLEFFAFCPVVARMSHHWCSYRLSWALTLLRPVALLFGHAPILLARLRLVGLLALTHLFFKGAFTLNQAAGRPSVARPVRECRLATRPRALENLPMRERYKDGRRQDEAKERVSHCFPPATMTLAEVDELTSQPRRLTYWVNAFILDLALIRVSTVTAGEARLRWKRVLLWARRQAFSQLAGLPGSPPLNR